MFIAKLKAAGVHGLFTLLVALLTATIVFGIWFPGEMANMLEGTDLFLLVLGVELAMGPLMSLVIYSPTKPKSELIRDYFIVGFFQLLALIYGVSVVASSRPVFIVFVKDRIEIVTALELDRHDLEEGGAEYKDLPLFGPKLVCTESPSDPRERTELLMSGLSGKDIQMMPKYYRDCLNGEIAGRAQNRSVLAGVMDRRALQLPEPLQSQNFLWLPAVSRFGFWTVVFEDGDINRRSYVNIDPFES